MKKFFTLVLFIISMTAIGQQYNNEWIRYAQTYYKFKVVNKGLYRIPKSALDAAGIGNAGAQFFELWRNGKQVPIYTSSSSGPLLSNGFIEFWGEGNDGLPDKPLYRNPAYQHSSEISLETDTAVYFLSVNTNQSGFMVVDRPNDVAGNVLPPEPYFMYTSGTYFKNKINLGLADLVGEYVYSSSYDKGEFWSTNAIIPPIPLAASQTALQVYPGGPDGSFRFGAMGDATNPRSVNVTVNNTLLKDTVMDFFNEVVTTIPIAPSLISSGTANVQFRNTSPVNTDRMVISFYEITYPRLFNFNGQSSFKFSLPATSSGYYLQISNFNYGSTAPILYNITTGFRITGDISTPGMVKIVVPASSAADYALVSAETINTVGSLTSKTFTRYTDAANQGDYLVITHSSLFTGTNGNNPIQAYKNYRSSAAGGSHDVVVVDIDELVDQFAFGIKKHPLSIKNFLRYARNTFTTLPKHVFLIGRGMTYNEFRNHENDPVAEQLDLVPTFGTPGSDNMLSSADATSPVAVIPIGRLSVIRGPEIEDYLEKVKEYENAQATAPNTLEGRAWMKNVLHVTGSSEPYLGGVLCNYMSVYRQIIEDTVYGGRVVSFCKTSTNAIEQLSGDRISQLFQEGLSIMTYFGHSSSTTLEFNLENPMAYNNQGKYPVFFVNGCNAGDFFTYNQQRLVTNETLSEKFVLAKERGSIAFVASTHYGIVNYLNIYLNNLYKTIGKTNYGESLGEMTRDALQKLQTATGPSDFNSRAHAEEITLHGDPALHINGQPKPDYIVEESQVNINPAFISVAEDNFEVKVRMVNIGRATKDSIAVDMRRQYPDGSSEMIYHQKIRGIRYADSLTLEVPINPLRDKGLNKLMITLDADFAVDEMSESNNSVTKEVFIFEDEARPAFPYDFSIVGKQDQKLYASTANPFSTSKNYVLEVDTSELFASPTKVSKNLTSTGGILEFAPGISFRDSTVYYWRIAGAPTSGTDYRWNTSSFVYLNNSEPGWNQSHHFQYKKDKYSNVYIGDSRAFEFDTVVNNIKLDCALYPYGANGGSYEGDIVFNNGCGTNLNSLEFIVYDLKSGKYMVNKDVGSLGSYGAINATCADNGRRREMLFDFYYNDPVYRNRAMAFLDSIPNGSLISILNWGSQTYNSNPQFVNAWKNDTLINGPGKSIYHKLKNIGLNQIDSFYRNIPFIFIFRKNADGSFTTLQQQVGATAFDLMEAIQSITVRKDSGSIVSTVVGPSKDWRSLHWDGYFPENNPEDTLTVSLYGIRDNNTEDLLYTSHDPKKDIALDFIPGGLYTNLRFTMTDKDVKDYTPYQLKYWQIKYGEFPEGAIDPKLHFTFKDSVELAEPNTLSVAFKNIGNTPFDSLKYKLVITDQNNVARTVAPARIKPLPVGDTVIVTYDIDTKALTGRNTMYLDVNPDGDQVEQEHFNNFLYKDLFVRVDKVKPILDVTFDGVHILNKDIVSARPHIQVKLKDEAKFLLLNDTTLSSVQVRYPDGSLRTYNFDNDTLRFIPATSGGDNTATIDFYPAFSKQYDAGGDEYELIVSGKDKSGNKAGQVEYRIAFTVITKAMISNLLNYPNPFSTSTAFVFTVTGSEVPQNMKIQILTVTGKIVREITKQELGPIHIGRNITDFKWDGNDQFGQKLGNGVYLYRFVTTLNGKRMEKYKAQGDNTDVYFNNGYGKMYLMR